MPDNPLQQLLQVMRDLRHPQKGCPWDLQQNWQSLTKYSREEVYELIEAIEKAEPEAIKDELGDLLYHLVFYAYLAEEQGDFTFLDVIKAATEKLIRRHPHVFAQAATPDMTQLQKDWQKQKQQESGAQSILQGISKAIPALTQAQKIQQRVKTVGFDWPEITPVFDKVYEELDEVKQAISQKEQNAIEEELGDALFALVNLVRFSGFDAESCLAKANSKFIKRFQLMEKQANNPLQNLTLDQMEQLWLQAKKQEKLP